MAISIKVTVTVNAPVEKVWEIFMDPAYLKHWLTGFISVEHLSGTLGHEGSTSKLKFLERGRELEVIEKVLHLNPLQQYSFSMQSDAIESLADVRFVSRGQMTEIIQAVQYSPQGFLMKLLMPFMKGAMKKRMTNDLSNLKAFIESQK
ncbi:MAG: SRPBCC family protein [Saprospiraceae bacterium]|nr:SRPBCC family protein [Saprospiraceae bacterium]